MRFSKYSDLPVVLNRRGIYYGWVVLFAGTVGVVMSVPGQTMGVSVYTEFLIHSSGISRTLLSLAYMMGTLSSAFLLPLVGRFVDRVGSRALGVIASLGLALSLVFLSHSEAVTNGLAPFAPWSHRWSALLVMAISFLGIRHFGQGQLTIASRTMMARWFEKRRGLMLGISGFFVAFAFGLAPLVLTSLIARFGWQNSLWILAGASCGMAAFAWLTFRQSPEQFGLLIDGESKQETAATVPKPAEVDYTAAEAKRTFTFWAFNLGMVAQALLYTAITFHMERIAQLHHMTNLRAFSVFFPVAIVSTTSELVSGYLSDKIPLEYLLAAMQTGICCGLVGLEFYGTTAGFALTALGFGIGNGLFSLLASTAWPKLFGRTHLGAIAGSNMAWIVGGSALGPLLFSAGESLSGSYGLVIYASLLIPGVVLAGSFFAKAPARQIAVWEEQEGILATPAEENR